MPINESPALRTTSALKTAFVADALAMPVHWYYNPMDILTAFPGGIQQFEAAPEHHPSSIMSLHSTARGGRRAGERGDDGPQVVGDVILKGRAHLWDRPNVHYHHGMKAGDTTLNAHCARVLMRCLAEAGGHYDRDAFLNAYIGFMTADPPQHNDTYAESYHRGFFAHYAQGRPASRCAMVTHDTPSIGGLVTIAPLALSQWLRGAEVPAIQALCREHLAMTHPDESLMRVCDGYVALLCRLLDRQADEAPLDAVFAGAGKGTGAPDILALVGRRLPDTQVVGRLYSPACYISDAWPVVLYLACKYHNDPWQALRVNTNLGGDNVHRGIVLGTLLGLTNGEVASRWFDQLLAHGAIGEEIAALVAA